MRIIFEGELNETSINGARVEINIDMEVQNMTKQKLIVEEVLIQLVGEEESDEEMFLVQNLLSVKMEQKEQVNLKVQLALPPSRL